jgi:hypothetical protein
MFLPTFGYFEFLPFDMNENDDDVVGFQNPWPQVKFAMRVV